MRLGNQVIGPRPDIDHLVVLLTLGYQAGSVLVFDLLYFARRDRSATLFSRNDKVIHTNRGTERVEYS